MDGDITVIYKGKHPRTIPAENPYSGRVYEFTNPGNYEMALGDWPLVQNVVERLCCGKPPSNVFERVN